MKRTRAPTGLKLARDGPPSVPFDRQSARRHRPCETSRYPASAEPGAHAQIDENITKKAARRRPLAPVRSAYCTGAFLPSLYVYKVVAAFFSSPFGSNTMLAVTPL
jgi:hypothetical protein